MSTHCTLGAAAVLIACIAQLPRSGQSARIMGNLRRYLPVIKVRIASNASALARDPSVMGDGPDVSPQAAVEDETAELEHVTQQLWPDERRGPFVLILYWAP